MKNNRRDFLKIAGMAGIGVVGGGVINGLSACNDSEKAAKVPVAEEENMEK